MFEEAYEMPKMEVDQEAILDAEKIAVGAFSPLEGFMERENYENVIYDGQLADGVPWTIPIILAPKRGSGGNEKTIKTVKEGDDIAPPNYAYSTVKGTILSVLGTLTGLSVLPLIRPWSTEMEV